MNVLKLIKERRTTRKYSNKFLPRKTIDKIIEAGIWAPSPHNSQPWEFIIIKNKDLKRRLLKKLNSASSRYMTSFRILFKNALKIIENAPTIILVYNTCFLSKKTGKFGEPYSSITHLSEIEGISAAIQNMLLAATSLGLGMAWLTIPLFASKEFSEVMKTDKELVAVLTLGFSAEKSKRLFRKPASSIAKYEI